ncbi:hypothetical protein DDI_0276 [Dickeya dianthicola RNS04.9]|nr:hypothetical protein DDI_0276 [Dickeya dianthicola RNS04.9]
MYSSFFPFRGHVIAKFIQNIALFIGVSTSKINQYRRADSHCIRVSSVRGS